METSFEDFACFRDFVSIHSSNLVTNKSPKGQNKFSFVAFNSCFRQYQKTHLYILHTVCICFNYVLVSYFCEDVAGMFSMMQRKMNLLDI